KGGEEEGRGHQRRNGRADDVAREVGDTREQARRHGAPQRWGIRHAYAVVTCRAPGMFNADPSGEPEPCPRTRAASIGSVDPRRPNVDLPAAQNTAPMIQSPIVLRSEIMSAPPSAQPKLSTVSRSVTASVILSRVALMIQRVRS